MFFSQSNSQFESRARLKAYPERRGGISANPGQTGGIFWPQLITYRRHSYVRDIKLLFCELTAANVVKCPALLG